MATAVVHKLLHHDHSNRESSPQPNQMPSPVQNDQDPAAVDPARDKEKRMLAQWEEVKRPLSPAQIPIDANQKMVGHSSQVLRQEDFELVKTLGTGMDTCDGQLYRWC